MSDVDSVSLALFSSRLSAVCTEMGAILCRSAFSPNIKDRLDFSCAVFDAKGSLCAQAAHIPVHLGSMAYAMSGIVKSIEWQPGDVVIVNDPYLGGTHLPDVTLISPVFHDGKCIAFIANRAHHANIGSETPGSMPVSRSLEEEGMIIPPTVLVREGKYTQPLWSELCALTPDGVGGDFAAQISANQAGVERLETLLDASFQKKLDALQDYAASLASSYFASVSNGEYRFSDVMDDDGQGNTNIPISVALRVTEGRIDVDFTGTSAQVAGNINCPLSVTAAAVYYVFRCLLPDYATDCAGLFSALHIHAPEGSLLNAKRPAAVAAGNVETSTRVVDVLLGALGKALPEKVAAASYGTMNNVAMGSSVDGWSYYETIGGGGGAHRLGDGVSAVQCHMTNTLNTPVESLEMHYPLRMKRYAIRCGSGGLGQHNGGDGIVREYEILAPATLTLLTERRLLAPWGLNGAGAGAKGQNTLNGELIGGKCVRELQNGDVLTIETPGGGGWNSPE